MCIIWLFVFNISNDIFWAEISCRKIRIINKKIMARVTKYRRFLKILDQPCLPEGILTVERLM